MAQGVLKLRQDLELLRGAPPRVAVLAHNSHVGDGRATAHARQWNIGYLCRETFGAGAAIVGFSPYSGHVTALPERAGTAPEARPEAGVAVKCRGAPARQLRRAPGAEGPESREAVRRRAHRGRAPRPAPPAIRRRELHLGRRAAAALHRLPAAGHVRLPRLRRRDVGARAARPPRGVEFSLVALL